MRIPPACHAKQLKATAALKEYRAAMDKSPVPADVARSAMDRAFVAIGEADVFDTRPMPTDKRKSS